MDKFNIRIILIASYFGIMLGITIALSVDKFESLEYKNMT